MQRYLWQQADGARHVYDTETGRPTTGQPLDALCGDAVTPRTQDMTPGMWFDPTCTVCEDKLVRLFHWSDDDIARLHAIRAEHTR